MFLQLLFGPDQRVAVHDGPENMPKLCLRRELAEFAFLGGEAVRVRRGRRCFFLGREGRAEFRLDGVQTGKKLAALFEGGVTRFQGVDLGLDFTRPNGELSTFFHRSRSPIVPARRRGRGCPCRSTAPGFGLASAARAEWASGRAKTVS